MKPARVSGTILLKDSKIGLRSSQEPADLTPQRLPELFSACMRIPCEMLAAAGELPFEKLKRCSAEALADSNS